MSTTTSYTSRLAAQKAATVDPEGAASEQKQEQNLPEDVRYDASKQLETDGRFDQPGGHRVGFSKQSDANQFDCPVHRTLPHSLPSGEAGE
eukprot:2117277-Ditylum_brightwellii.AAC.1